MESKPKLRMPGPFPASGAGARVERRRKDRVVMLLIWAAWLTPVLTAAIWLWFKP